ncbi:MAG: restriction endonuclease subunit S [Ruminococcus sp.]|nr:restriction endonuclease subunit S [Ruminococcus sp.]
MKTYESMKSSSVFWLGMIPEHWECMKIGSLFSQRKNKVSDKDYAPLSVTKMGILPQLKNAAKSNDGDNRKLVCAGDFVINSRSDRKGSCGVSELDGSVSLINLVLTPRSEWNNRYAHYLLRSQPFSEEYYRYGRGIVADLWTTRFSEMKNILLPVPPQEEQNQIVRFLDWKVSEINRLINIKRKEIERLEELKHTLISNAIENSNVQERTRFQFCAWIRARLGWRGLKASEYVDKGYPFLSAFNIVNNKMSWLNLNYINQERYNESPEIKLSVGDILLVKDGAGIGKCARIDDLPYGESAPNGSLAVITPNDFLEYRFLYYFLLSNEFKENMNRILTGMGVPHLTQHFLKDVEVPIPNYSEQVRIADILDKKVEKLDELFKNINAQIEALQEFKTRLISDVVTGKIDVRGIEIPEYEYISEEIDEMMKDKIDDTEEELNEE